MEIFPRTLSDVAQALRTRLSLFEDTQVSLMLTQQKIARASKSENVNAIQQLLQEKSTADVKMRVLKDSIIADCKRCKLCKTRTNIVFGSGNINADLVFVGEAPGAEEDKTGEPFMGRAGKLLTKMIEAMELSREQVYICNVVKCRPPENRNPEPDEIAECEPFLKAQLAIMKPKVIVALGRFACQCLSRSESPISTLRGVWTHYEGIPLMPTYHPAYLLRSPSKKKEVWEDLQAVMLKLKEKH